MHQKGGPSVCLLGIASDSLLLCCLLLVDCGAHNRLWKERKKDQEGGVSYRRWGNCRHWRSSPKPAQPSGCGSGCHIHPPYSSQINKEHEREVYPLLRHHSGATQFSKRISFARTDTETHPRGIEGRKAADFARNVLSLPSHCTQTGCRIFSCHANGQTSAKRTTNTSNPKCD